MPKKPRPEDLEPVMGRDPLTDDEEILASTVFRPAGAEPAPARPSRPPRARQPRRKTAKSRPTHYKVVSISLYNEDIERLDEMVQYLKENGHPKANRSALIRYALDQVDITKMPKSY